MITESSNFMESGSMLTQPETAMEMENHPLSPWDEYNQSLHANVSPPDWINPEPSGRYNLVVIGAGTAGLVTAAGAAGLGAKVALIERHAMGGDCLNVGCVPSKALIRAARTAAQVRQAGEFGVSVADGTMVDFAEVMQRMRRLRAQISPLDSAERFRALGVDVFLGAARFLNRETIEVEGRQLKFAKAVIATGARAAALPIPGLVESNALTNETLFSLTELPRRLAVIGAGPIGCEMAQTFQRFGSEVTMIEVECKILIREDQDAAVIVAKQMEKDGVKTLCEVAIQRIESESGVKRVVYEKDGEQHALEVDEILVGVGRAPNVEGLDLEKADVKYNRFGVDVDDNLRTSNRRIFAAGDICMKYKFTHVADFTARIVIQNALFGGRRKASALTVPWCTFTDPEIAHVGLYEQEAQEQGIPVTTYTQEFSDVDRAILDGESEGLLKVHVRSGTDKILGATLVSSHAGETISELTLAMVGGIGLGKIANVIHPYPTQAEAIRKLGDAYNRTRLTPLVQSLFQRWLAFTR